VICNVIDSETGIGLVLSSILQQIKEPVVCSLLTLWILVSGRIAVVASGLFLLIWLQH
jgi:hypothetical protein